MLDQQYEVQCLLARRCTSRSTGDFEFLVGWAGYDALKKTKHILRAAEFLRDLVMRAVCYLVHVPGERMVADMLTKPLSRATFLVALKMLDALYD